MVSFRLLSRLIQHKKYNRETNMVYKMCRLTVFVELSVAYSNKIVKNSHFLESPAHLVFLCNNVLPVGSFLWRWPIFMFYQLNANVFGFSNYCIFEWPMALYISVMWCICLTLFWIGSFINSQGWMSKLLFYSDSLCFCRKRTKNIIFVIRAYNRIWLESRRTYSYLPLSGQVRHKPLDFFS